MHTLARRNCKTEAALRCKGPDYRWLRGRSTKQTSAWSAYHAALPSDRTQVGLQLMQTGLFLFLFIAQFANDPRPLPFPDGTRDRGVQREGQKWARLAIHAMLTLMLMVFRRECKSASKPW